MNARLTTRAQKLAVGAGATIVAGVVAAVAIHLILAWRHGAAKANQTGTVYLAVDGGTCRRLVIDHRTATVISDERVPCADPAKEQVRAQKEAPRAHKGTGHGQDASEPSHHPGGARIDAVRNSFINR